MFDFGIPEDGWTHLTFDTCEGTHYVSFSEQMDSLRSLAEGVCDCLKKGRGDALFCTNNPDQETEYEHWVLSVPESLDSRLHLTIYSPASIRINTLTMDCVDFVKALLVSLEDLSESLQNPRQRFPFPTDHVMYLENWLENKMEAERTKKTA